MQIGALVAKLGTVLLKMLPLTNDTNACPVLNTELLKINFIRIGQKSTKSVFPREKFYAAKKFCGENVMRRKFRRRNFKCRHWTRRKHHEAKFPAAKFLVAKFSAVKCFILNI